MTQKLIRCYFFTHITFMSVVNTKYSIIYEKHCHVNANCCIVYGDFCVVNGRYCIIIGKGCHVNGSGCFIDAPNTTINGADCLYTMYTKEYDSHIFGSNCVCISTDAFEMQHQKQLAINMRVATCVVEPIHMRIPNIQNESNDRTCVKPIHTNIQNEDITDETSNDRTCGICLEHIRSVAFQCGHILCPSCAKKDTRCPFCRKPIQFCMNVFI